MSEIITGLIITIGVSLLLVLMFIAFNWGGELLWNFVMPLFHVRTITFWQFAGLSTLLWLLFGSLSFSCRLKN